MKKLMLLMLIAGVGFLWSAAVSIEDAQLAAGNMIAERGGMENLEWTGFYQIGAEEADLYVFNYNNSGYVMISADDRAVPVLAYSFEGIYDPATAPVQLADWFFEWQWQMAEIRTNDLAAGEQTEAEWQRLLVPSEEFTPVRDLRDVSPLLTCNWNQDSPWNQHCPRGPGQNNPFVYSGCVAVSMAQVMYYWGHPTTGTGSHSYNHPQYGNISCDFSATDFDYDSMNNSYATYETKELQWACGVAVEMDYGSDGSGAQVGYGNYSARNAMVANFDYHPGATFRAKDSYSTSTYEAYIRADLDAGYPLIYSGVGGGYGHAFNLDGYQGTSFFHFNWGWSGYANGYFYLSNLNPGGSSFNEQQGGVFSLFPYEDLSAPYDVTGVVLNGNDVLLSWDHNELDRSLLGFNVYNNGLLEDTTDPDEPSYMVNNLPNGTYLFWVTALFVTGESDMSEMVTINIAPATAPVADAGDDITAVSGEVVTLNGSGSYDLNGDALSYYWTAPVGITLSSSSIVNPVFTAPAVTEETDYIITLTVSDGTFFSDPDEVVITVALTGSDEDEIAAGNIELLGNHPNPFNPETEIVYNVKTAADVNLSIYNLKGQMIRQLVNARVAAGEQRTIWNGLDDNNHSVSSGLYYYKVRSGRYTSTGKMVLLK
ncbi:MAG: C10 family peptidase [Candidatus Cloacimonetes bacterium]|nr:C10 family peptidase [Candidatus Cloacimonadota bacterium]